MGKLGKIIDKLAAGSSDIAGYVAPSPAEGPKQTEHEADMLSDSPNDRVRNIATAVGIINADVKLKAEYQAALIAASVGETEEAKRLLRKVEQDHPDMRSPQLDYFINLQLEVLKNGEQLQNFLNNDAPLPVDQPAIAPTAEAGDASVLESHDLGPESPLTRKLELAEEFRQIGDIDGARDLLEEVKKKDQNGPLEQHARAMLAQLETNPDLPLTLLDGQPDQPAALANLERPTLDKARASIEGGYLYRAPNELKSIIDNTESTAEDKLAAKTLLDQVELVLKTDERFWRLVRARETPGEGDTTPSDKEIIDAKKSAIKALRGLYPDNGEDGSVYRTRRDKLHAHAAPYEAPANPPALDEIPVDTRSPEEVEQQEKIAEVERTKKALADLVRARQLADIAELDIPDNLTNQEILRARAAAMRALGALYPVGAWDTSPDHDKYEAVKKEIYRMSAPYLNTPTPPSPAAPPIAGGTDYAASVEDGLPKTPQQLRARLAALFEEMGPAEAVYNRERKGGLSKNKKRLINATEDLCRIYKEYAELAGSLFIDDIPGIYIKKLKTLEQELAELNKPTFGKNLGRRASLIASGVIGAVSGVGASTRNASKKVGDEFVKLKKDLAENPEKKLEILKQRSLASAKKLSDLGINLVDGYGKFGPKTKLAVGVLAMAASIPFAGIPSALLKSVSTAAFSRRSYQKMMQKFLEQFAYNQFVKSKKDFYENTLLNLWKQADIDKGHNPKNIKYLSFDKWIDRNNKAKYPDWEKEKEEFIQNIKTSDFEADPSYKNINRAAVAVSLITGITLGAAVPTVLRDLYDRGTFNFIKDTVSGYMPGALKDTVRHNDTARLKEAVRNTLAASAPGGAAAPTATAPAAPTQAAPAGGAAATAPQAAAPHVAQAATPVAAPVVAAPSIDLENFQIASGDNLETLMKDKLGILSGLNDKQKENVIYNFLESSTGDTWMKANKIENMNRIFTGNKIDLQSLSDAISRMKIDGATIIEKARNNASLN